MAGLTPLLASSIQQAQEAREKSAQTESTAHTALKKTLLSVADRVAQLEKELTFERDQRKKDQEMHRAEIDALKTLFLAQIATIRECIEKNQKDLGKFELAFHSHVHDSHNRTPKLLGPMSSVPHRLQHLKPWASFPRIPVQTYKDIPKFCQPEDQKMQ
jgi:hypothetical protein